MSIQNPDFLNNIIHFKYKLMKTQKFLSNFSRRSWLKGSALVLGASLIDIKNATAFTLAGAKTPALTQAEIEAIEAAMGKKGMYKEAEAVHTTPLPRNDLKVTVKGEAVPISFGFGGWAAIKKTIDGKSAVLMSDCVLLQEEVNPLISAAHANGLEVSAIHNHFFYEEPRIFYMHIHGMGSPEELAKKYAKAIAETKISPANQPPVGAPPTKTGKDIFDMPKLNGIVKYEAAVNGPTIKYTIGRDDLTITAMGAEMTSSIGLNTWASFTGSMDNAMVAGDIAMLEHEVNSVIKVLRTNNIEVVAVHNHMLGDKPHMIFLHYLGRGPALQLAKGFRAALDQLGKGKKMMH
ncbi:MAG TPA: DUF1259 domain-containing protein [Sediminibacterium sp.]|uniref:DUF1259 domain-containing protein n=2 Tax=Chitinophagales TaxID=1853229 RepID=UPI002D11607C|nr:DUF1259 domain-containing protein [Sediminibacterium sp.]HQS22865.1 DUF1259 domain-containing protein [Sediminibacterium sp.]HQS33958.1 DUF1259 domain-containing protein [Sediminibacterium sp.]